VSNLPSLEVSSATLAEKARGASRPTHCEPVYLDYHASTPCDPRVVEAMLPFFIETFANPSSSIHAQGRQAAEAVDKARAQVGQAIGAASGEVIFTSGATESNNLAIQGAVRCAPAGRRKVLATAIEHKCVLESCKWLAKHGYDFDVVPVGEDG
jgi:cysteine desulfurase